MLSSATFCKLGSTSWTLSTYSTCELLLQSKILFRLTQYTTLKFVMRMTQQQPEIWNSIPKCLFVQYLNFYLSLSLSLSVQIMCTKRVCVCERERERERQRGKKTVNNVQKSHLTAQRTTTSAHWLSTPNKRRWSNTFFCNQYTHYRIRYHQVNDSKGSNYSRYEVSKKPEPVLLYLLAYLHLFQDQPLYLPSLTN